VLDGVAAVALAASGGDPTQARRLTKHAWTRARGMVPMGTLPGAETVRQRVGLTWSETLALALRPVESRPTFVGQRDGSVRGRWGELGDQVALRVLRSAAAELGHPPTAVAYDALVRRLEAESLRWRRAAPLRLPRSTLVLQRFDTWESALAIAGLVASPRSMPSRVKPVPSLVDTLDRCIDATGVLPVSQYVLAWAACVDIPVGRRATSWASVVKAVRAQRSARGVATPDAPTAARDCPPLPAPVRRRRRCTFRHTRQDVLESLRQYAAQNLRDGRPPRRRDYLAAAQRDPLLLAASVLQRHGGFQTLCREAGIG